MRANPEHLDAGKAIRIHQPPRALRVFLEALPVAVYTTDASGLITSFNQAAVDLVGRSPEIGRDRWCVTWRLYWPDGRPMRHEDCPMAVALRENRAIRGIEAIGERPDGTRFPFMPHATPMRNASGAVDGGINVLVDISDRKADVHLRNALISDLEKKEAAMLQLVDAVLRETQRHARSAEAQELIEQAIGRVATISATQSFLYDPDGATRINSWDLLVCHLHHRTDASARPRRTGLREWRGRSCQRNRDAPGAYRQGVDRERREARTWRASQRWSCALGCAKS